MATPVALSEIQAKLNVPKGQFNKFGKYKYRSCEDIVEAVKPLLAERNLSLIMSDEIVLVGDRYYIKATVSINSANGDKIETTAYAREELVKKGMDGSQITGTASSYARKYALNGLLSIDDNKDADTEEHHKEIVAADNSVIKKLATANTMEELQEAWMSIPEAKRGLYTAAKNNQKDKLNETTK